MTLFDEFFLFVKLIGYGILILWAIQLIWAAFELSKIYMENDNAND